MISGGCGGGGGGGGVEEEDVAVNTVDLMSCHVTSVTVSRPPYL